jgi:hypothetical protein
MAKVKVQIPANASVTSWRSRTPGCPRVAECYLSWGEMLIYEAQVKNVREKALEKVILHHEMEVWVLRDLPKPL